MPLLIDLEADWTKRADNDRTISVMLNNRLCTLLPLGSKASRYTDYQPDAGTITVRDHNSIFTHLILTTLIPVSIFQLLTGSGSDASVLYCYVYSFNLFAPRIDDS